MLVNSVLTGYCLRVLADLPAGSVQLCFADPPFNIGLNYPGPHDDMPAAEYLAWLGDRFAAVRRVLVPTASLFVAIGQTFQAEVLVMLKALGFHWRNTLIWHYTFGPCQRWKFTPSWTAIHYVTMHPQRFTFNTDAVRVPSARQTDYGDKRANATGKVPDDIWLLRPRAAERLGFFGPEADTWHIPRVAGTFRERQDHVCQMPVAILERIIAVASDPGDLVVDPFAGTGTTLVAAKRLGRQWLGVEKCERTAELARNRLANESLPLPGMKSG
jgi:DNA modification methylase